MMSPEIRIPPARGSTVQRGGLDLSVEMGLHPSSSFSFLAEGWRTGEKGIQSRATGHRLFQVWAKPVRAPGVTEVPSSSLLLSLNAQIPAPDALLPHPPSSLAGPSSPWKQSPDISIQLVKEMWEAGVSPYRQSNHGVKRQKGEVFQYPR